jgi:hypothetical protein
MMVIDLIGKSSKNNLEDFYFKIIHVQYFYKNVYFKEFMNMI